jgi:ABC-2 type transport system permease protein
VLQLTLFGFALSASVSDLRVGIVDESRSPESRELVATLTESRSFHLGGYFTSGERLGAAISQGKVDVGVVIPYQYARDLHRGGSPTVQVLLNAMNANTATIGHGYVQGVIESYNRSLSRAPAPATGDAAPAPHRAAQVHLMPAFLYNPGLVDAWFIATGVFGLLLILNSSLIASAAMVKEREAGTIEQLLMSPASTAEIIVAKIVPLFVLLSMMMVLALGVLRLVFRVPFNGSLLLVELRRSPVHSLGDQPRHGHRDVQPVGPAGAAHRLLREPSHVVAVRRVEPGRGDARLAPAADGAQPHSSLRDHRPRAPCSRAPASPHCGPTCSS